MRERLVGTLCCPLCFEEHIGSCLVLTVVFACSLTTSTAAASSMRTLLWHHVYRPCPSETAWVIWKIARHTRIDSTRSWDRLCLRRRMSYGPLLSLLEICETIYQVSRLVQGQCGNNMTCDVNGEWGFFKYDIESCLMTGYGMSDTKILKMS